MFDVYTRFCRSVFAAEGRKMEEVSVEKLYEISMTNKIIISMSLPALDESKYIFKSYKVRTFALCL